MHFILILPLEFNEKKIVSQVVVIELNPFLNTTDGALFSWEHERSVMEGTNNTGFEFRITNQPKVGSKAMLSSHARRLIDQKN